MNPVFESPARAAQPNRQLSLQLRKQREAAPSTRLFKTVISQERWDAKATAIIVCDSWDLHHSINAVRRLEEFAPRLNEVLLEARDRGVTIIHSPSDCMEAYADHPARQRAIRAPKAIEAPHNIDQWCLKIPSEERAEYPIDQSDGGEDDDPQEHAKWVEHLKALGRNPGTPWKKQTDMLVIDGERDYLSSLGDEVWNVLEQRGIKNVILTGVHLNMCVLGRPFGIRQLARAGKNVVLMRDMTDTMYNPARWPYVDHFTGTDRVIAHVERHVCPTITSDQVIGGQPFRFKSDHRPPPSGTFVATAPKSSEAAVREDYSRRWVRVSVPGPWAKSSHGVLKNHEGVGWYRCVVRIPVEWRHRDPLLLVFPEATESCRIWVNGQALELAKGSAHRAYLIEPDRIAFGTGNWIVVRVENARGLSTAPLLTAKRAKDSQEASLKLEGDWQLRIDDNPGHSNPPLPAQFGGPSDIVFEVAEKRLRK